MVIIGITGTLGAGKGTVVDYLVSNKNYKHYSVRNYLIKEIENRKLTVDRNSMVAIANDLRTKYGPSFITQQLFDEAKKAKSNCIIESVRNPSEAEFIKSHGGTMIAVDADQKIRYERIKSRATVTDNVTFEEFKAQEEKEMICTDPNSQNLQKCIEMSDIKLYNNGSIESLNEQVENKLRSI